MFKVCVISTYLDSNETPLINHIHQEFSVYRGFVGMTDDLGGPKQRGVET